MLRFSALFPAATVNKYVLSAKSIVYLFSSRLTDSFVLGAVLLFIIVYEFAILFSPHQYRSCSCFSISDLLNIVSLGRIQLLEITILSILKWPAVRLQIWGLLELQLNLHDAASILEVWISVCKHLCFDEWQSIVNDPAPSFYFSAFTDRDRADSTHTLCDFCLFKNIFCSILLKWRKLLPLGVWVWQ